jgi:hypothetical protein
VNAPHLLRFAAPVAIAAIARLAAAAPHSPASPVPASGAPAAPGPAEESASDRAAKLRLQGNEAMLGMRYTDALASYENAAALAPDEVGLDYSIARARQMLGDYPEALTALERFESRAPPEARAKVGNLEELFAQIRPRVSVLQLRCPVPGARVIVRDKVLGATPLPPTRLGAGTAIVQLELEGFFTETREVALPGAGSLTLDVELHAKSTSGVLSIRTDPLGADVRVDGRSAGTSTPRIELALPAGPHEVVARREGYDEARVPFFLAPGSSRELTIPMSKSVPVTARWWFWSGVALVVAGGVATGLALTTERPAQHGTLSPGQVGAP